MTIKKSDSSHDQLWLKIKNSTWNQNDGWAGQGFTFFEDQSGRKKCLFQTYGSGVYITSSALTSVSFGSEKQVVLGPSSTINGLQLGSFLTIYELQDDSTLVSKERILKRVAGKPQVFNSKGPIDLSSIQRDDFKIEELSIKTGSHFEGLAAALKNHLAFLSKTEREKIPPKFQTYLLTYDEGLSERTIGGWSIADSEIMKITKWYVVSESLRVAASFEVEQKSVGTWSFN